MQKIIFYILHCTLCIVVILCIILHNADASAWLVDKGKYKFSSSFAMIDDFSKKTISKRANLYLSVQDKINHLHQLKSQYSFNSATSFIINRKIKILTCILSMLDAYQDKNFSTFNVEYGINNSQNCGIGMLYKQHEFGNKSQTISKYNDASINYFFKQKIYDNNSNVISITPQLTIMNSKQVTTFIPEIIFSYGYTKRKIKFLSIKYYCQAFVNIDLGFAKDFSEKNKHYFSCSRTEGIKLPYNLMFIIFNKQYIRTNYNAIYEYTKYKQYSIAKQLFFSGSRFNNCTMQIGYFIDKGKYSYALQQKVSGFIFSLWAYV